MEMRAPLRRRRQRVVEEIAEERLAAPDRAPEIDAARRGGAPAQALPETTAAVRDQLAPQAIERGERGALRGIVLPFAGGDAGAVALARRARAVGADRSRQRGAHRRQVVADAHCAPRREDRSGADGRNGRSRPCARTSAAVLRARPIRRPPAGSTTSSSPPCTISTGHVRPLDAGEIPASDRRRDQDHLRAARASPRRAARHSCRTKTRRARARRRVFRGAPIRRWRRDHRLSPTPFIVHAFGLADAAEIEAHGRKAELARAPRSSVVTTLLNIVPPCSGCGWQMIATPSRASASRHAARRSRSRRRDPAAAGWRPPPETAAPMRCRVISSRDNDSVSFRQTVRARVR